MDKKIRDRQFRLRILSVITLGALAILSPELSPAQISSAKAEELKSYTYRPTIYDILRLDPHLFIDHPYLRHEDPNASFYLHHNFDMIIGGPFRSAGRTYWLPKNPLKETNVTIGFNQVAELERVYPGAVWVTIGGDAEPFADMLEIYYARLGQMGRVVRLGVSGGSFRSGIEDKEYRLLQDAGIVGDRPNAQDRFVLLDSTHWSDGPDSPTGKKSQTKMLLEAYYKKAMEMGFAPSELFRRANVVTLKYRHEGSFVPLEPRLSPEHFFSSVRANEKSGVPYAVLSLGSPLHHPVIELNGVSERVMSMVAQGKFPVQSVKYPDGSIHEEIELRWHGSYGRMNERGGHLHADPGAAFDPIIREHILSLTYNMILLSHFEMPPITHSSDEAHLPLVALDQKFNDAYARAAEDRKIDELLQRIEDVPPAFRNISKLRRIEIMLRERAAGRIQNESVQNVLEAQFQEWQERRRDLSLLAYVVERHGDAALDRAYVHRVVEVLTRPIDFKSRMAVGLSKRIDGTKDFAKRCVKSIFRRK